MTWVDWFFWIALTIFIWQFVAAWRMESDQEWYKKHPRGEQDDGGASIDPQPPRPPDIVKSDIVYNMPPKPGGHDVHRKPR